MIYAALTIAAAAALLTLLLRRARDQHDLWPQGADDDERILAVIAEAQREAGRAARERSKRPIPQDSLWQPEHSHRSPLSGRRPSLGVSDAGVSADRPRSPHDA